LTQSSTEGSPSADLPPRFSSLFLLRCAWTVTFFSIFTRRAADLVAAAMCHVQRASVQQLPHRVAMQPLEPSWLKEAVLLQLALRHVGFACCSCRELRAAALRAKAVSVTRFSRPSAFSFYIALSGHVCHLKLLLPGPVVIHVVVSEPKPKPR